MKSLLRIAGVIAAVVIAIEFISSYTMWRYYSATSSEYRPDGFATFALANRLWIRIHGSRKTTEVTVDHRPLFDTDPKLGFRVVPGSYRVDEKFDNVRHQFHVNINARGERITSYFDNDAERRVFITGDSAIFGWGLDDEQTIAWLLQSRLPKYQVVNLSLTSYSTLQTAMRLQQVERPLGPDDSVMLVYHKMTNDFNVVTQLVTKGFSIGYELQVGNEAHIREMQLPYGDLDAAGNLVIRRYDLACQFGKQDPGCMHPDPPLEKQIEVTKRAFDQVFALHPGHVLIAFVGGSDSDPVIQYLRQKGAVIVDMRIEHDDPDGRDIIPTDSHAGAFWHHTAYLRLLDAMRQAKMVDERMTAL